MVGWVTVRTAAASGPSPFRASRRARRAFTLVELLTVIAVIGVLTTLLFGALASARKKSWQARCTSQLHQLSLALNMYLDDFDRRPRELRSLVGGRYLSGKSVLICPADRTGNWGGTVNWLALAGGASANLDPSAAPGPPDPRVSPNAADEPAYSYLHALLWPDEPWDKLLRSGGAAGLAACQLHGLGRPGAAPSFRDYQGLVLRAQRDGAVVRRTVFWAAQSQESRPTIDSSSAYAGTQPNAVEDQGVYADPWPLFSDESSPFLR